MTIETWDRTSLDEQETVIGRTQGRRCPARAPPGARHGPAGRLPATSHVRLAHPSLHGGARLLRRGYNFVDGSDGLGTWTPGCSSWPTSATRAGLRADPDRAGPARRDERVRAAHRLVAVGVPPGVGPGGWWGQTLLG
jgi:deferrochelatase/peroxidase EfeB